MRCSPWGHKESDTTERLNNTKSLCRGNQILSLGDSFSIGLPWWLRCSAGDPGSIPVLGRSPREGNGNPLQYSCLENPINGGTSWASVHGLANSWTQLSDFIYTFHCESTLISTGPDRGILIFRIQDWKMGAVPYQRDEVMAQGPALDYTAANSCLCSSDYQPNWLGEEAVMGAVRGFLRDPWISLR